MIDSEVLWRWFGFQQAFDNPVTLGITVFIVSVFAFFAVVLAMLTYVGKKDVSEAWLRWVSWTWLTALMLLPILAGAFWTCLAVVALSIGCFREFATATGINRQPTIMSIGYIGIVLLGFATLDHYDRLYFAITPLIIGLMAIVTLPSDKPQGYVQRVSLGAVGFVLFGLSMNYLACFTNDVDYRPQLLFMLLSVSLNDIYGYCFGKLIGGPKLVPHTSPGKTVSGFIGALIATTLTCSLLGHYVFQGTVIDAPVTLVLLGATISLLGQFGDLVLSSIKRDIGVKDMGSAIPGHGGLLDRFDSLILVPPAVFHFLSFCLGPIGSDQPVRILTSWFVVGG